MVLSIFFAQSALNTLASPQVAKLSLFYGNISSVAPPRIKDALLSG